MTTTVNTHAAKTTFSKLVERVHATLIADGQVEPHAVETIW